MFLRSACVAALCALTARHIGAQQPTIDRTRALAIAFARATSPADSAGVVDLVDIVDGVPPELEGIAHLPTDVRVVATLITRHGATVLATAAQPTDSVLRHIAQEYARADSPGVSTTVIAQPVAGGGGFRSPPPAYPRQFCHDGTEALPIAIPAGNGLSLVQLRILRASPICSRVPATRSAGGGMAPRSPLPLLRNPENATPRSECFVTGGSQRTQTQLATSIEPGALFTHYAQQLDAQGWTRMPESPVAHASWSRRDTTGLTEVATLSVSTMPAAPTCREAQLEVTTIRRPQ